MFDSTSLRFDYLLRECMHNLQSKFDVGRVELKINDCIIPDVSVLQGKLNLWSIICRYFIEQ